MNPLTEERLRSHPELASLATLATQLELLPMLFASVHNCTRRDAMVDQARSMSRVSQILLRQLQVDIDLAELGDEEPTRRR